MAASVPYDHFGRAFVAAAVSSERVAESVRRLAGETVDFGPLRAGPAGAASVVARGRVRDPRAKVIGDEPLRFEVRLPVDVHVTVRVGRLSRFDATGEVKLRLAVATLDPPALRVDVDPVCTEDVNFDIHARDLQARLLHRAGDVPGELRRHVARYVNERVSAPDTVRYTTIDLVPFMERVWEDLHAQPA